MLRSGNLLMIFRCCFFSCLWNWCFLDACEFMFWLSPPLMGLLNFLNSLILCISRLSSLLLFHPLDLLCHLSDVDECEAGVCAEECLNTPGSFRCYCDGRQGMKLSQDLRSCKVKHMNCGKSKTSNVILQRSLLRLNMNDKLHFWSIKPFWMRQFTPVLDTHEIAACIIFSFILSVFLQPLTPCMSPPLKRNSRSLYLGRMFSGVPVVRLRFRRRIQTGWEGSAFSTVVSQNITPSLLDLYLSYS